VADPPRRPVVEPLGPQHDRAAFSCGVSHRGQGWGRFLLADALHRCLTSEIVGFAVIVDAKDDSASRFYERESFLPLPDTPNRLFRRLRDIEALLKDLA
jgi:hypothetical protein